MTLTRCPRCGYFACPGGSQGCECAHGGPLRKAVVRSIRDRMLPAPPVMMLTRCPRCGYYACPGGSQGRECAHGGPLRKAVDRSIRDRMLRAAPVKKQDGNNGNQSRNTEEVITWRQL